MEKKPLPVIATNILNLIKENIVFTDIQLKTGEQMAYRAPRGYVRIGEVNSADDMAAFAAFSDEKWQERISEGGGQFDVAFNVSGETRLRCNFFHEGVDNTISISIRRLTVKVPLLSDIGVPQRLKGLLYQNIQGLILIAGPTGSGKTTTQASLLEDINANLPMHILTIEQPIEYKLKSNKSVITQREVLQNVQSFGDAMVSAKRQRPDIIMIGEVRDKDTVSTMLEAADSGALVIAGTHAKSPEEAVDTLLNYYSGNDLVVRRNQLAQSLLAINAQRLLPSKDDQKNILVYELLVNTPVIKKAISDGDISRIPALIQANKGDSIRLNEVLTMKIKQGEISEIDAYRASRDYDGLSTLLGRPKPPGF